MKKFLAIAAFMVLAVHGFADEKTMAAAEKLLVIQKSDKAYEQQMAATMQMIIQQIDAQNMPDAEKTAIKQSVSSRMQIVMDTFSWAKMKKMFVEVYAEVLSLEDLEGLIKFYESPVGQSFIEKQPKLNKVTQEKMQAILQQMMPEIQKALQDAAPATADK